MSLNYWYQHLGRRSAVELWHHRVSWRGKYKIIQPERVSKLEKVEGAKWSALKSTFGLSTLTLGSQITLFSMMNLPSDRFFSSGSHCRIQVSPKTPVHLTESTKNLTTPKLLVFSSTFLRVFTFSNGFRSAAEGHSGSAEPEQKQHTARARLRTAIPVSIWKHGEQQWQHRIG